VTGVAFSPDGRRLAAASGILGKAGEVKVWDAATGQEVFSLPGGPDPANNRGFNGVAFSPDGRRLAAACGDHTVKIWDVAPRRAGGGNPAPRTLAGHTGPVLCVAFSPDGQRLASAGEDRTVRVWDAATGQELRTLRGHTHRVRGATFSPDSQRIASASEGLFGTESHVPGEIKIWDAVTGQETLTLPGLAGKIYSIVFSPDGWRLAAACEDRTVRVWDTTPPTPALFEHREASNVVQWLFTTPLDQEQVVARLRSDATLRDDVRQLALDLTEPYSRNQVRRQAEEVVVGLFARQGMLRPEVLANVRANTKLSEAVRREALALAERYIEDARVLIQNSRAVVRRPDEKPAPYRRALLAAETACRLAPYEEAYPVTLGLAQYRVGDFAAAAATLTQAVERSTGPAALAGLAMAQHRLGQEGPAQATLARLREVMKQPRWANNAEARGLAREAESLLQGR
jgi:hypothetical protein